jgi:hypothetical protein
MSIDKRNTEGYSDPTAYTALTRVELEEKKAAAVNRQQVYICSPYAGDTVRNVERALRYCRFAIDAGYDPVAPHVYYTRFLDDSCPTDRKLALHLGLRHLKHCRELWVFGGYISSGMEREIGAAIDRNIKIRYFTDDCEEVPT